MKKTLITAVAFGLMAGSASTASFADGHGVNPEQDREKFVAFFQKRYPDVAVDSYVDGIYALNEDLLLQHEADEEFPPYEDLVAKGEELWNTPFANGKTYASCFNKPVEQIRGAYPYYDAKLKRVETLESAINECRKANNEKPLKWKKGALANISGFLVYSARGEKINTQIEGKEALAAYQDGKEFFYAKRGQLNLSCADCHVYQAGRKARSNVLSPALGHVSHFPVFRKKWNSLGTLHRRYGGCQKNMRAKPMKAQSDAYRNMELFHTYMSNGLEFNGPRTRG